MFYCKDWLLKLIIFTTIFLQVSPIPMTKRLKQALLKRRIPTTDRNVLSHHTQAATSAVPLLKIQQNTGALPILKPIVPPVAVSPAPYPSLASQTIDNNYNYEYSVHDTHTGDIKEHKETRNNDMVEGYYSLIEPNGRKRVVHYNSNNVNGFHAYVTYENADGSIQLSDNQMSKPQAAPIRHIGQFPPTHVSIHTPVFSYKY